MPDNIFDFIRAEETRFGQSIEVMPNWNWSMKDHVSQSILMKHGKFIKATNEIEAKNPKKNIVYPLLNLRYRAEDIDLKDVVLYVNSPEKYHLSFLVKKYHDEVYVRVHDLDTFFDEVKEEKIDLGGALVRKGSTGPVYESMDSIAFCDQTDILSGPIGFSMFFSPDELMDMASLGWGDQANGADTTLEALIDLAEAAKTQDATSSKKTDTPGKYIQAYRVHGSLPTSWLIGKDTDQKQERYTRQIQIVAFYDGKDGQKTGVTLYKKREHKNPFKIILSGKKLRNRALAFGGVEEIFDQQVWTDYSIIRKKDILDAVSKIIRVTDDPGFANKNKIRDMENNQVVTIQQNARLETMQVTAPNVELFNQWVEELEISAQTTTGATDALQGKEGSAGKPFRLEALQVQQGMGLHEYRRGKYATFIAEIYDDWILPDIGKEITKGVQFLATLSGDEMEYVANCVARNVVHKEETEAVLAGSLAYTEEQRAARVEEIKQEFARRGNKHFLEILKGEFADVELSVQVNVAGKQKDLQAMADSFSNILKFVFSTYDPNTKSFAALEDPKALKAFNKLIEYSGLDPIDFGYAPQKPQQLPVQQPVA